MNFTKQDIIENLEFVKNNNLQVILVEADKDKGFNYSYLMYCHKVHKTPWLWIA